MHACFVIVCGVLCFIVVCVSLFYFMGLMIVVWVGGVCLLAINSSLI